MSQSQFGLLSERRFGPLFWTQFLGALNDNLFKTAFIFLITYGVLAELHDAALWTPMLNGLLILPFFLFSATAGQLADKLEKARLIRWIKLWEVAVMGVAAAGFLTNNAWLLAGTLFLMGTQSAFFGPVKYAILPQALGKESLVSGNALIGTATFLAILLGSMGGGLLIETGFASAMTAGLVLVIASVGFLVSRRIPDAPASDPGLRFDWNPMRQAVRVCRYAAADPSVWRATLGVSWFWFFGATLLTLFPTYGKNVLHVNEQVVTFFLMVFCVGIGLGALLCGRIARHRVELGLVPAGAAGLSLFVLDLFFASLAYEPTAALAGLGGFLSSAGSVRIVFDLLGLAVCGGAYIVPLNALIQGARPRCQALSDRLCERHPFGALHGRVSGDDALVRVDWHSVGVHLSRSRAHERRGRGLHRATTTGAFPSIPRLDSGEGSSTVCRFPGSTTFRRRAPSFSLRTT